MLVVHIMFTTPPNKQLSVEELVSDDINVNVLALVSTHVLLTG